MVLVVQRQGIDGDLLEDQAFGCQARNGVGEFAVEGILAQAAHDDSDLDLAHALLLEEVAKNGREAYLPQAAIMWLPARRLL
ncbi:hypothetical protein ACHFCA_11170 [Delftia tsuruhatensis]